jgi:hypothetical protein
VTPLLGGFEDNTTPPTDPAAPTLTIRGMVVMGGVEVKHGGDASGRSYAFRHERHGRRTHIEFHAGADDQDRERDPGARG